MISLNPAKYARFAGKIWRHGWPVRGRSKMSLAAQAREIYALLQDNRLEPEEYYRYELFDPRFTAEGKRTYLSRRQQVLLEHTLNPTNEEAVLNKFVFKILAQRFAIAVPDWYGLFNDLRGFTPDNRPLQTAEDLRQLIASLPDDDFLLKPISGMQGRNIMVCTRLGGEKILVAGEGETTAGDLAVRMTGTITGRFGKVPDSYLVEQRVRQHSFLDNYTDSCTQTCRIVLLSTRSGDLALVAAVLKIGKSGKYVDNVGQTGMAARLDAEGVMGPGIQQTPDGLRYFDRHPETDYPITGQQVPGFAEAVALARRAQAKVTQLRLLGWDVAITEDGPMILEGNNYWAWEMMQRGTNEGLLRGELKEEVRLLERQAESF